jgi:thiol-disulfide isomerase/thioredoxin
MSLADQIIAVGPLSIPVWLPGVLAGIAAAMILQRALFRASRETWAKTNDALLWGVIVGLLIWKLTPLATRLPEIRELPSRLLYYPGGTLGVAAGALVAASTVFAVLLRGGVRARPLVAMHALLPIALGGLGWLVTIVIPAGESVHHQLDDVSYLSGYEAAIDREQPTVITAWATWCGPCTAQMPEIDRFYDEHGSDVNVVALNLTSTEPSTEEVRDYLDRHGLEFPVAVDETGAVSDRFGVTSTPTTVVLDAAGRERARRVGAVNRDWLSRRVLPLRR